MTLTPVWIEYTTMIISVSVRMSSPSAAVTRSWKPKHENMIFPIIKSHLYFITNKRTLSQKSLYPGLFTNWPGVLWMGFVSEIRWPEMKSTAANNKRMLRYFKRVATLRDKNYPNRSFCVALRICFFNITISWKRFVFYRNGSAHKKFRSSKGLKKHWLLKFQLSCFFH